jgi:hypothetical protein
MRFSLAPVLGYGRRVEKRSSMRPLNPRPVDLAQINEEPLLRQDDA